jgi:hypothetical protein
MVGAVMEQAQRQERQPLKAQSRDRELVRLVGRHGAMTIEQVMRAMRCGRTASYRRVARCVEGGLIERCAIPGVSSAVLIATRAGLSYAGLGLPVAKVSAANITHTLRCTTIAIRIELTRSGRRVFTEREIVLEESIRGKQFASVVVGRFRGKPKMHRADLLVEREDSEGEKHLIPIEVELTPKSPARLRRIIAAWRDAVWAGRFSHVEYCCERGQTHRAVRRAASSAKGGEAVVLIEGKF